MKNLILLMVLVSGLLAGYLIGEYRGKDALDTLKKAIETGKTLDSERETAISKLKTELGGINDKHQREISAIRKDSDSKIAEWRRTKTNMEDTIKRTSAKLAESDNRLKSLVSQRDSATGAEKTRLELEIERLQNARADLLHANEGNVCLHARIPPSVFEALNDANVARNK